MNAGLVNGAIVTIFCLSDSTCHSSVCGKVKSRLKTFYIYRRYFPLILSYAFTIHKCQGLSLDCVIVNLSDKVFSAGMAYVAILQVQTL